MSNIIRLHKDPSAEHTIRWIQLLNTAFIQNLNVDEFHKRYEKDVGDDKGGFSFVHGKITSLLYPFLMDLFKIAAPGKRNVLNVSTNSEVEGPLNTKTISIHYGEEMGVLLTFNLLEYSDNRTIDGVLSNLDLGTWDDVDYYTDIKVKSKHKVGANPSMELTRNQLKEMIILFLKQHDWCHPLEPNVDIDRFERVFICAIGDTYIEMHLIVDLKQYDVYIG